MLVKILCQHIALNPPPSTFRNFKIPTNETNNIKISWFLFDIIFDEFVDFENLMEELSQHLTLYPLSQRQFAIFKFQRIKQITTNFLDNFLNIKFSPKYWVGEKIVSAFSTWPPPHLHFAILRIKQITANFPFDLIFHVFVELVKKLYQRLIPPP